MISYAVHRIVIIHNSTNKDRHRKMILPHYFTECNVKSDMIIVEYRRDNLGFTGELQCYYDPGLFPRIMLTKH